VTTTTSQPLTTAVGVVPTLIRAEEPVRNYDAESMSARVAEYVELFRNSEDGYLAHEPGFLTEQTLQRSVSFRPGTWLARLEAARDRASAEIQRQLEGACSYIRMGFPIQGDATITRADLVALSQRLLGTGKTDLDLISMWVATMAWGSGKTNGRGPWRLEQSLCARQLVGTLRSTHELVQRGQLAEAHAAFDVYGIGESFFTKWFWVASLSAPQERRALILDKRVRTTLWRLQPTPPIVPKTSTDYATFVAAMHDIGRVVLPADMAGDAAEKVEWLLFDRRSARSTGIYRDLADHLRGDSWPSANAAAP
jgi:hypothetical protein